MSDLLNSKVRWTQHGKSIYGQIVAVVPANTKLIDLKDFKFDNYSTKPIGDPKSAPARNHESYLVEVLIGERGIRTLYWPNAGILEPIFDGR